MDPHPRRRIPILRLLATAALVLSPFAASADRLRLDYHRLALPAAPSVVVPADLDEDGIQDLVIVVATTRWDRIGVQESVSVGDVAVDRAEGKDGGEAGDGDDSATVEGLVEVLTVIPALLDQRQLLFYRGLPDGGYVLGAEPLDLETPPLETPVLSVLAGPSGTPVAALTDDGLAAVELRPEASALPRLGLQPVVEYPPVFAGSGSFVPGLELVHDLDGDGEEDLLLPAREGPAVFLAAEAGLSSAPAWTPAGAPPGSGTAALLEGQRSPDGRRWIYPLPKIQDLDGDGRPELLVADPDHGWDHFSLLPNLGEGRFGAAVSPLVEPSAEDAGSNAEDLAEDPEPRVVHIGDLDGDGVAEVVTVQAPAFEDDAGLRRSLQRAKRPVQTYRFYHLQEGRDRAAQPYLELEAEGYAFAPAAGGADEDGPPPPPGGFLDLNGDGRQDLVTITLDFSMFQALKVLTVQRLSIGLDFHIWCQEADGGFRRVRGLDLAGRLKLNLNDLRRSSLSQFAGDFDGDGRADFVQMGRGRTVTIHRGGDDCGYAPDPDLSLRLAEEPRDLSLVQIRDLDGDDRADLLVIQPGRADEAGVTPPVQLDLYLSRRSLSPRPGQPPPKPTREPTP
ncbi:MAG: VCBS repeat-containing protein [Acidobacteriota bacterium]|nr:VCBS repeat-containing protein [Acidobacteriota bacterium]